MTNKIKPFWVDYGVQGQLRQRLDHFVINLPAFEPGAVLPAPVAALDARLGELSSYFTHFSFRMVPGSVKVADSVNEALRQSDKGFCLIQNFGHLFYGSGQLSEALKQEMENCHFVTGHIMAKGAYYYLHNQCILVNRRAWLDLGCPDFGDPGTALHPVAVAERSAENVHDDYTPLYLNPTGRLEDADGEFGYGWNAISESLERGLTVRNWSQDVRKMKRFCYAYYGRLQEWMDALNSVPNAPDTDDGMLAQILTFLRNTPDKPDGEKKIFLYNTEHDVDIPKLYFSRGIDRAFLLASGFKGNRILDQVSFGPRPK